MTLLLLSDQSSLHSFNDLAAYAASIHKKYILIDFYADWCGPCKTLSPILSELANDASMQSVLIVKINVDHPQSDSFSRLFSVRSLPTLFFINLKNQTNFSNMTQIPKKVGLQSKIDLITWMMQEMH